MNFSVFAKSALRRFCPLPAVSACLVLGMAATQVLCLQVPTSYGQQTILFHGADLEPTFGADGEVFDFLVNKLGEGNVTYMQGDLAAADGSTADGFSALVISATLNSGTVRNKYADLQIPVLNWEQALMRNEVGEFNMSDGGATPGAQAEIEIVDNQHFITRGFDVGVLEVSDDETFSVGRGDVGDGVQILANLPGVENDHAIMVAEAGAALMGSGATQSPDVAPARRATIFLQDNTFAVLNDAGLLLFDRTIDWILHREGGEVTPGDFNSDGKIDLGDYQILVENFHKSGASFEEGDIDFNTVVNLDDFVAFRSVFESQPAGAAAVPEPSSLGLLVLAAVPLLLRRRRYANLATILRTSVGLSIDIEKGTSNMDAKRINGLVAIACLVLILAGRPAWAQQKVLFHGEGLDPIAGTDGDVFDFLVEKLGEPNVTYMQGDLAESDGSSANGFDALIISATLSSGTVRNKYADIEIPVLNWEQALMRNEVGEFNLSDGGATSGGQTEIEILDNAHFITQGFDLGVLEVSDAETYSVGQGDVGAGVKILASLPGSTNDHAIMVADKEAELMGTGAPQSPAVAPERRATLFLEDDTFGALNDDGLLLFDRTLDWLLRRELQGLTPGDFNNDGSIDLVDFNILASNFGGPGQFEEGDMNVNGFVDLTDFVEFRRVFNAQPAGAAAVPEPSSWLLLAVVVIAPCCLCRRRLSVRTAAVRCEHE